MTYRLAALGLMMVVAATASASGQSLAELARQEEARRKAIQTPAKVYTNESLRAGTPPPARPATPDTSTAAAPAASASAAAPTSTGVTPQASARPAAAEPSAEPKDEAYWTKRMEAARDALARAQIFADALQSRINALSTDFVNRDDPAQRAVIATDRQRALAELDRLKQEIAEYTKGIAALQEEARRAGVPPGWLR